jgi:hypothetical protein
MQFWQLGSRRIWGFETGEYGLDLCQDVSGEKIAQLHAQLPVCDVLQRHV